MINYVYDILYVKLLLPIVDILFPSRCKICKRKRDNEDLIVCNACYQTLKKYRINVSLKDSNGREIGLGILRYDGVIRFLIHKFKFDKKREFGELLADLIFEDVRNFLSRHHVNYIVPIPIHKERMKERGFNQSEIIAKKIAKRLNIQFRNDLIIKEINTPPQSTLKTEDKKSNVRDTFKIINELEVKGKDLVLFDDIYTTGSTIEECAKILFEHNTRKVYYLSVSISNRNFKEDVK